MYRMLEGEDLSAACRAEGVPRSTFRGWVTANRDGILERYARTLALCAQRLWDQGLEIVDDGSKDWVWGPKGPRIDHAHIRRSLACARSLERRAYRLWDESRTLKGETRLSNVIIQFVSPEEIV